MSEDVPNPAKAKTSYAELAAQIAQIVIAVVAISSLIFANFSVIESQKARRVGLIEDLYSNERWWYNRMAEYPFGYSVWARYGEETTSEEYITDSIMRASPGTGKVFTPPRTIEQLNHLLWDPANFVGESLNNKDNRLVNLRRSFDMVEVMFYHLDRIYGFRSDGIVDDEEANTWLGLLHQIGPHPLLLAVADDARRGGYVSSEFAEWFLECLSTHPNWHLVEDFYPRMTKTPDLWISDFKKEEASLRFLFPKGIPSHP